MVTNPNGRGSMYPEDQMMGMLGGPKALIGNKFCVINTSTVTEVTKLLKLGLRPEDINSQRSWDKDDWNPIIEETGYVGMTTRLGIKVLGVSFKLEFIQDSELTKPREVHLELADLEFVKSPPLVVANNRKEDKWDPTNIYRLEVKNQSPHALWYWERSVEINIMNEDEARDLIEYFWESTIEIEIFNGLSEMRVGVFKVPLRYFLKRGEKYMRWGLWCEVTDNDRKYVIGEIYLVMENETVRPVPPNPDDEWTTEKKS